MSKDNEKKLTIDPLFKLKNQSPVFLGTYLHFCIPKIVVVPNHRFVSDFIH